MTQHSWELHNPNAAITNLITLKLYLFLKVNTNNKLNSFIFLCLSLLIALKGENARAKKFKFALFYDCFDKII